MNFNIIVLLVLNLLFIGTSFGFYVDDFKTNENSSVIETLQISFDVKKQQGLEFPNEFTVNLTSLLSKTILFLKINKTIVNKYPIKSDDIYTVNSEKKLVKASLSQRNIESYEVYQSQDGKSVATLIKNLDSSVNPYRMLATINVDGSTDVTYNVLPVIDRARTTRKRLFSNSNSKYDSNLNSHAIIRGNLRDFNFDQVNTKIENVKIAEKTQSRVRRSNNGVPFNLTVEYLIVADSSVFNDQRNFAQTNNTDLIFQYMRAYFAHYVNSINQRYINSFQNDADMRLTVRLTNILVFQNQSDCPWTDPSLVGVASFPTYNNKQVIAIDKTLTSFSNYMNAQTFNFTFDHAVALFDKDLWDSSQASPATASQVVGFSPIKGVCTSSKYSLAEEIGGFRNAIVGAHELGHNLGAYHDGVFGDQFSPNCLASDNYLMTASLNTNPLNANNQANNIRLSSCSVNSIKSNLLSNNFATVSSNGQCLTNSVGTLPTDYLIDNKLPGQYFTANDQCKQIYGSASSFCQYLASGMCSNLACRNSDYNCELVGIGAASGTTCGPGKACINSVCTNSTLASTSSTCPFGDDPVNNADMQQTLSYLDPKLPNFTPAQLSCEAALAFYASNNYSLTGFCQDFRTAFFQTSCCATCRKYSLLSCSDKLLDCPTIASRFGCGATISFAIYSNTLLSSLCPITCNTCSAKLTCANNLCQNGATCSNLNTASLTAFSCSCATGYSGSLCEIKNPCLPNPCLNGGVCQQFGSLGYVCSCLSAYSGYTCNVLQNGTIVTPTTSAITGPTTTTTLTTTTTATTLTTTTTATTLTSTTTGSSFIDYCASRPCLNGGSCVNGASTYSCLCLSGFTGINCQTSTSNCLSNPCQNGGTCTNLIGSTDYSCRCRAPFTGINCQTNYLCNPNPCSNGGICVVLTATSAFCQCPPGISGALCQFGSNACSSRPCLNNGACNVISSTQYNCTCQSGFFGQNCQLTGINPCVTNNAPTCLNNGVCVLTNTSPFYFCQCRIGFSGTNCQTLTTTTTTRPTTTTLTTRTTPASCVDMNPTNCAFYAANNFCRNNFFVQGYTVPAFCPKSCGICSSVTTTTTTTSTTSVSTCTDTYSACSTWKAAGYCKLYPVYIYCRRSCALC